MPKRDRPARGRRHYTEADKATALASLKANANNFERTARECKVPRNTLRRWADAPERAAPAQVRQEKESALDSKLEAIANRYADALDDDVTVTLIKASRDPSKLATVLGVSLEKLQLLRGKPTAHISLFDWLGTAKGSDAA